MARIKLNLDSIAMMLFCARLKAYKEVPLTVDEWLMVEKILKKKELDGPSSLLSMCREELEIVLGINEFVAYKMIKRLSTLNIFLSVLSNLESNGINVTTKYEEDYPETLLKRLNKKSPLYLFYCGDISKIKEGVSLTGLATVTKDREYTKSLVDKMIKNDLMYISNDCKGIDEIALRYALQQGGQCIDFVCERLTAKQNDFSKYLKSGQLVMLCAEDPNSYFDTTNAIERNSYVSALSKYQIIVSSNINNGDAWFTALQNLHNSWTIPMVIDGLYPGNDRLLDMGITPIDIEDILSNLSIDMIYEKNKQIFDNTEANVGQMSIFEFIGE